LTTTVKLKLGCLVLSGEYCVHLYRPASSVVTLSMISAPSSSMVSLGDTAVSITRPFLHQTISVDGGLAAAGQSTWSVMPRVR